jgi:hypothetical protein
MLMQRLCLCCLCLCLLGAVRCERRDLVAVPQHKVDALLQHIEPKYSAFCQDMFAGKAFSFSQAWQDWVIFHHYFNHKLTWGAGTYIDIGANNALSISNTLFFDKVSAEKTRKCSVLCCCGAYVRTLLSERVVLWVCSV